MRRFHHIVTKSTKSCQRLYSATIPLSPQFRHGAIGVTPARLADNTMKNTLRVLCMCVGATGIEPVHTFAPYKTILGRLIQN